MGKSVVLLDERERGAVDDELMMGGRSRPEQFLLGWAWRTQMQRQLAFSLSMTGPGRRQSWKKMTV
jgi:hypothetical protein